MEIDSYDTSRLFSNNTGPHCDGWDTYPYPYCSCPSGKVVGDTWYHDYRMHDNGIGCAKCKCLEDNQGRLYTDCTDLTESSAFTIYQGCDQLLPVTNVSCHRQFSVDSGIDYCIFG